MTDTIWKFQLPQTETVCEFSTEGKILHVGNDADGTLCVWVQTEKAALRTAKRTFHVVGTGRDIPDGSTHVGSCVTGVGFVWHVYMQ